MSELWDEVPEAKTFCEEVRNNIERYKLYPDERFEGFIDGIAITTNVDLQGDCFSEEDLYKMADQINKNGLWQRAEHNPLVQPMGRVIAAHVFYSPKSNVHFVAIIAGYYDTMALPTFQDIGVGQMQVICDDDWEINLEVEEPQTQIAFNPHEIEQAIIDDIMRERPSLLYKDADIRFRKAAEPISILHIVATVGLLTANPFSKKFLERLGERSADAVVEFFGWLKSKVVTAISEMKNSQVLFEFEMPYKGCQVEFVVNSKNTEKLLKAIDSVHLAGRAAVRLIDRLEEYEFDSLVYEFDTTIDEWLPLHAATKKMGVISDKPVLVALDRYHGFSVSGSVKSSVSIDDENSKN